MRGQAAFEYLVLFGIALLLLGILVWYSQNVTQRNRDDIIVANAINAVNKIVEASNIVYTQGKPSQLTIDIYIPEKVTSIQFSNNIVIMQVSIGSATSDIIATSKAPLQGNLSSDSGMRKIKVIAEENYVNVTQG